MAYGAPMSGRDGVILQSLGWDGEMVVDTTVHCLALEVSGEMKTEREIGKDCL